MIEHSKLESDLGDELFASNMYNEQDKKDE